jgi:hypothetical protein
MACRAILSGECSAALAGGVGLMGNIIWFQNLAGASFLSPTGQVRALRPPSLCNSAAADPAGYHLAVQTLG